MHIHTDTGRKEIIIFILKNRVLAAEISQKYPNPYPTPSDDPSSRSRVRMMIIDHGGKEGKITERRNDGCCSTEDETCDTSSCYVCFGSQRVLLAIHTLALYYYLPLHSSNGTGCERRLYAN